MALVADIKNLIRKDQLDEAIKLLLDQTKDYPRVNDLVLLISGRYEAIVKKSIAEGTEDLIALAQISKGVLGLSRMLEESPESINETKRIEIHIDIEKEEFTEEKQKELLENIARLLKMGITDIRLGNPREGSIILPMELPSDKAEKLLELINEGELEEFKVVGATNVYIWLGEFIFFFDLLTFPKDLSKANLKGANLRVAKLGGANLEGANIGGANIERANLERADLRGANLERADLRGANLGRGNLRGANLRGANLGRVNLERADLQGANLEGANLEGAQLKGADFQEAKLWRAILLQTDLTRTKFQNADLAGANLEGVNLEGAKINLEGANLEGVNLKGAKLQGLDLQGANLSWASLYGAGLRGADLRRTNLQNVILIQADLAGANLKGANLRGAKLQRAKLQGVNLQGANLYSATAYNSQKDILLGAGADISGVKFIPDGGSSEKEFRNLPS